MRQGVFRCPWEVIACLSNLFQLGDSKVECGLHHVDPIIRNPAGGRNPFCNGDAEMFRLVPAFLWRPEWIWRTLLEETRKLLKRLWVPDFESLA